MKADQPKIAVLGCGYWGQNLVRNFRELGVLKLVCDPAESGRNRAREIAPAVEISEDFDSAFERDDIDGIVLATPAETHHSLGLKALSSGKDLLVEKPLALNYQQGLQLQASAEKHQRILMVGHLLEYHPAVLKLREMIAGGELGKVNYIYSNRLNFGKIRTEENALWSFAPHDIAVILRLFGEMPIEVTCVGGNYITPTLADVTVSCLHFATGQRAHIFVSWLNPFKEQKLVVVGDKQMAVFNDVSKDEKLTLHNQRVDLNNRQPILQKGEAQVVPLSADEPLRKECEHFIHCILTRSSPLTDAENGIKVLKVLQACQTSLQLNGRPTVLSEI
ncbi:MAG: Gfo/Idh/MocA family oxidoreductase [Verrucomicrobiota bacterium]|nr:Gfo/Idh/MocA family oxidoreductase [Verrucomicrobiota bacterium]